MAIPLQSASAIVGMTSTPVLTGNPLRQGCVFTNLSKTATISLGLGGAVPAVLEKGITLRPGDPPWTMDGTTVTTMTINAISSEKDAKLAIQEFQ